MQANESGEELAEARVDYQEPRRNGESSPVPPRSRRFHFNGRHWFFRTRERITFGPYDTFREAEQHLKLYLRRNGIMYCKQEFRIPR